MPVGGECSNVPPVPRETSNSEENEKPFDWLDPAHPFAVKSDMKYEPEGTTPRSELANKISFYDPQLREAVTSQHWKPHSLMTTLRVTENFHWQYSAIMSYLAVLDDKNAKQMREAQPGWKLSWKRVETQVTMGIPDYVLSRAIGDMTPELRRDLMKHEAEQALRNLTRDVDGDEEVGAAEIERAKEVVREVYGNLLKGIVYPTFDPALVPNEPRSAIMPQQPNNYSI